MAKKPKFSKFKKFVVIVSVLIVAEGVFIVFWGNKEEPVTIQQAIDKAVNKNPDTTNARKEQAKVQLAVVDFMAKHGGVPPTKLDELIPTYFESIPIDPETSKPFEYKVEGKKFALGTPGQANPTRLAAREILGPGDVPIPASAAEQKALIASLSEPDERAQFVYDPTGKRDPFAPFDFTPEADGSKTPLERYTIGQLRLTAVLAGFDEPAGIVEDQSGKGYTVKKGTKIGPNGGEVIDILSDKLLILETVVDFTGEKKTNRIELPLKPGSKSQKSRSGSSDSASRPKRILVIE